MASDCGNHLLLLLMVPLLMAKTAMSKSCLDAPPDYPTLVKKPSRPRSSYFSSERIFYDCALGYTNVAGSLFVTCKDGLWTQLDHRCEPHATICPSPSVANGVLISGNSTSYRHTDSVRFACRVGFDLNGPKEITCGPDGQWDPQPPRCQPSADRESCGPPVSYPNMHSVRVDLAQRLFPPKSRVAYRCSIGYTRNHMRNQGTRPISECTDGRWTRINMKCLRKVCGSAGEILHGHYEYKGVQFGDQATAVCDQGYELIGRPYRHCLEMGWDGRDPVCEAVQCDEPPSVAGAEWSGPTDGTFPYRTVVTYHCLQGRLIGKSDIYCTHNGRWSSKAPMCRDVTCPNPTVLNGEKTSGFRLIYKYGDTVSFRCREGYVLYRNSSATCSAKGHWKPSLPKCIGIKCPEIKVENTSAFSKHNAVGRSVTIKCKKGFRLQGEHTVSCLPDGSWDAILPKCV